ncbi:uncharacterized protein C8A04DRAFT_27660 [Dichotomopilus funicola]|uniref:FAD-binding domain-containing protein n=1 Tax=Dichotomopilus funicola TaxID=1934379 RepID=A0AAN6ZNS5_9PEZI|nr:hypothetical protein C8A04DRAFT_27660 [Dichotomopilus funicola]
MSGDASDGFRVVIAGGGVAGLTLANALEQANVDYVLLERRDEIAPQVGASIGIFPNGARILDQLGAWENVNKLTEVLRVFQNRDGKGNPISKPDRSPQLLDARTGYPPGWGERQNLLRVLHETLKDPSKLHVNKNIVDIQQDADGVQVRCADGTSYSGHLLVGADGVFSKTRSKIWELAEPTQPKLVEADRKCMIAEYNCLFGICHGVDHPAIKAGDANTSYSPGRCALTIASEGGKVYWFAQERLPRTYHLDDIPRYTQADADDFVKRHSDIVLIGGEHPLTLPDLWEKTVTARLVAVEEAKFRLWHWGRIVCAGDSIHKSTPNLGVGGNAAIESVASLANGIKQLADLTRDRQRPLPSLEQVETMLVAYQKERENRANAVVDASGFLARAQNMHGLNRWFVTFLLPHFSEFVPDLMINTIIGAVKLDYLPLPMASLTSTTPFNPTQGDGMRESRLKRAVLALSLLGICVAAFIIMNVEPALEWAAALRDGGVLKLPDSNVEIPVIRSFYGLKGFDDFVALVNTFFFSALYDIDAGARQQVISFLTDGMVLLTIWYFEAARRANMLTILEWPALFALLGQLFGIGLIAPIWCFLHYVISPIEKYAALDQRLTNTRTSFASLPAVALFYLFPVYAMLVWPDFTFRQSILFVWQLYPIWMALGKKVFSALLFKDTMDQDKLHNLRKDIPVMKYYLRVAGIASAGVWWWTLASFGFQAMIPSGLPQSAPDLFAFADQFLRWDWAGGFGSSLVWLAYLFWDLSAAGMLREGWFKVVGLGLVSAVLLGPGATMALGWLFREDILATRRHKAALTPESVGRLHGKSI